MKITRTTTICHMVYIDFYFHFLCSLYLHVIWNPHRTEILSLSYLWINILQKSQLYPKPQHWVCFVIVLRAFDSTVSLVYLQVCSPRLLHTVSWGPFGGDRGGNGGPMLLIVWMWKSIIVSVIEEEAMCLLIFYIISVFQSAVWHHFTCFMMLFQGHVTCQNLPGYCKSNASA